MGIQFKASRAPLKCEQLFWHNAQARKKLPPTEKYGHSLFSIKYGSTHKVFVYHDDISI